MKAVAEIEKMMEGIVPVKKALWYTNDGLFKNTVDEAIKIQKNRRDQLFLFNM